MKTLYELEKEIKDAHLQDIVIHLQRLEQLIKDNHNIMIARTTRKECQKIPEE